MFESRDDPDIDRVLDWFQFQRELIGEKRAEALRTLATADIPASPLYDRFTGFTPGQIDEFFEKQIE